MTIRKAIQWLEMYANRPVKWDDYSDESREVREEAEKQIAEAFRVAIDALKAQEPRLVTEYDFDGADEYGWLPAWCEEQTGAVYCECILADALKMNGIRYWTSRPSDEVRRATPWES